MSKRFLGVALFAVLVALGASVVVYRLIVGRMATTPAQPTGQILVATRDIPVGYVLKEGDFEQAPWSGQVPAGAVSTAQDALDRGAIIATGRGEPLLQSHFAAKGSGAGLAVTIPPGKRAIAIRVNDVAGLAGYVIPGMRVDVIAMGTPPNATNTLGTQARTLLQNVEVLSAGQNIQKDSEGKPVPVAVVNLLATPEEAEILSLAGNYTSIQLVLRNPLDQEKAKTPGTATAYLFAGRPAGAPTNAPPAVRAAIAKPAPKPPKIEKIVVPIMLEVVSGSTRSNVKVGQIEEERVVTEEKK